MTAEIIKLEEQRIKELRKETCGQTNRQKYTLWQSQKKKEKRADYLQK